MEVTYEKFIQSILDSRGRFACGEEYHERHHILPKCMGGADVENNLIDLFAKEHFEAHRLLALENPDNDKLVYAWHMMSVVKDKNQDRYEVTPEEYEEAKILFSKSLSNLMKGKPKTESHKQKIRDSNKGKHNHHGKNNPRYGKRGITDEGAKKISESNKKRVGKLNANSIQVLQYDKNFNLLKEWGSLTLAGKALGYSRHRISNAIKNKELYHDCYWEAIQNDKIIGG